MTLMTLIAITEGSRPAINLDISRTQYPTGLVGGLVVNCSVDTAAAELDKIATLNLLSSKPYGMRNDLEELASLDIWSSSPKLTDRLAGLDVSVEGNINSNSPYLTLTWRFPGQPDVHKVYKCEATGINSDGQVNSVSTIGQATGPECSQKLDDVKSKLDGLELKAENTFNLAGKIEFQLLSFGSRFEDVQGARDNKVASQLQSLSSKFDALGSKMLNLMTGFENTKT